MYLARPPGRGGLCSEMNALSQRGQSGDTSRRASIYTGYLSEGGATISIQSHLRAIATALICVTC